MKKNQTLYLFLISVLFNPSYILAQNSSSSSSPAAQHDSSPTFGGLGQARTKNTEIKNEAQKEEQSKNNKKSSKNRSRPSKSTPSGP